MWEHRACLEGLGTDFDPDPLLRVMAVTAGRMAIGVLLLLATLWAIDLTQGWRR